MDAGSSVATVSRVGIVGGCGHVGLPLAICLADAGLDVVSYDLDPAAVATVMAGRMPFLETGADAVLTKPTVGNVQGRLRYDYFLHERVSIFAMLTARHDKFQGLQARVNVDPGVAFYILKDPKNRLWTEVGYDFQFDRFLLDATYQKDDTGMVVLDGDGAPVIAIDRQRYNHAVRLFGGYTNQINSNNVAVSRPAASPCDFQRINAAVPINTTAVSISSSVK